MIQLCSSVTCSVPLAVFIVSGDKTMLKKFFEEHTQI